MGFTPWVATIGSLPPPLSVANGGTGATTAAGALAALGTLVLQANTTATGYTLVNGTGNVQSWTAPADGNMHRVTVVSQLRVTSAETGGSLQISFNAPDGTALTRNVSAGGQATGTFYTDLEVFIQSGSTVTLSQNSALTVGAAILWSQIWGL